MTSAPTRRVRATASRAREHIQEILIHAGDSLSVGHRNQQHPGFVWCATEDGHHGWVPEAYIERLDGGDAVAAHDYDSAHLTIVAGETLEVLEEIDDYVLCRNAGGATGWVPASGVEEITEES